MQEDGSETPASEQSGGSDGHPFWEQVHEFEKGLLQRAVAECRGDNIAAAQKLGVSPRNLLYLLHTHQLPVGPVLPERKIGSAFPSKLLPQGAVILGPAASEFLMDGKPIVRDASPLRRKRGP